MVKDFTLAHGPAHAHPRHVRFIEAIPLAGTNKPDRRLLAEQARVALEGPDARQ
jgi:acyl-CoA synthetase (AMP-forming)/AMP-acid ligase II